MFSKQIFEFFRLLVYDAIREKEIYYELRRNFGSNMYVDDLATAILV